MAATCNPGLALLFSLLAVGALASQADADYSPTRLYALIGRADVIAAGTIAEVTDDEYVLAVDDWIAGERREATLQIYQFRDWTCAQRWAGYAAGQRVLVFLRRDRRGLRPIGAAGEGESPIVDGQVYCQFPCVGLEDGSLAGRTTPKLDYPKIREAIVEYRLLFRLIAAEQPRRSLGLEVGYFPFEAINLVGKPAAIVAFANRSELHASLVDETLAEKKRLRRGALTGPD